tara:strand:+ start:1071 stop:2855 length:1785 start_codon:yes stop_codon:yes gene_type:complete
MILNLIKTLKKLLRLLDHNERKNAIILVVMMLVMAVLDTLGVASILPFMAVLTNPDLIETNFILNRMFQISNFFGVENNRQFLFALGILVFILLITSILFKTLTTYMQLKFVQMREFTIGRRLVEGYLRQPYAWFLNRHSADLGKTILSEVEKIVGGGFKSMMELIAKSTITVALLVLLFVTDPKLTLVVGLSLGCAYAVIFFSLRRYLKRIGNERLKKNSLRFKSISEAFGAAKEIKVGGLEKSYIERFSESARIVALNQAAVLIISQLPRYILEAITFGGVLLTVLYLMVQTGSFNNALPIISLYVFAGYRLMPALQSIYSSLTALTFIGPSIDKLTNDIKNLKPFMQNQNQEKILFNKTITLKNIYYNYPNTKRTALENISLNITEKSIVGLVGATGSGKTTTVDIILGLLEAQKGTLEVDGKIINKQNSRSWQKLIGYVPQHIFLADENISSNIAFGVDPKYINQYAVERASKIANLHNFVIDELPEQYNTTIGERGVRLSGGQRQRIGIARALYNNPKLLILDEATSALDNQTEHAVMEAVNNLRKDITIILIAHRLNTVKNCDVIFKLEKGQVTGKGTFGDLIDVNKK